MALDMENVKKTKLVQLSSVIKINDDFGKLYDNFDYSASSHSTKSHVNIKIPSYPNNLMYYENFRNHTDISPFTLSFVYVGSSQKYPQFSHYKDVISVVFFKHIEMVQSCFKIISELPNCDQVKFILDSSNINLSVIEKEMTNQLVKPFKCGNVKKLSIIKSGSSDKCVRTKLHEILEYAKFSFPSLETVHINITGSSGYDYEWIKKFLSEKVNLAKHNIVVANGVLTCNPITIAASEKRTTSSVGNHFRSSSNLQNFTSAKKVPDDIFKISDDPITAATSEKNSFTSSFGKHFSSTSTSVRVPISTSANKEPDIGRSSSSATGITRCKLEVKMEKEDTSHLNNGTFLTTEEDSDEIIELKPPPRAPTPPLFDITSDNESESSPAKKLKRDSDPLDNSNILEMNSSSNKTTGVTNSLTNIESTYKQSSWESSDEENDSIRRRPAVVSTHRPYEHTPRYNNYNDCDERASYNYYNASTSNNCHLGPTISAAVNNELIRADDLKKVLQFVSAAGSTSTAATGKRTNNAGGKRKPINFEEGVHYERRPKV